MSCKRYAAEIGVNPSTLAGWRYKLRRRGEAGGGGGSGGSGEPSALGFVDVTKELAAELAKEPGVIEVELGGALVRVRGRVDVEALSRVLGVLEGRR
jgi:transposase-like protein